ncbi:MAG: uroporphyrinogen decarboxylase [Syntrophothermus sp.]|nr:uroporphyrinogen decarboxylase [Syntrophothermus sp.]
MSDEVRELFNERLKRYQAAIALAPTDRIPIAPGTNYFAEVYSGFTNQEYMYDASKWIEADRKFIQDFPETDVLRTTRVWGPIQDVLGFNTYKLPGRELPPCVQFQFIEGERMKLDEYDILIRNPAEFLFEIFLPRVFNEMRERGSIRSYVAFLKGGLAQGVWNNLLKSRAQFLENEMGMPLASMGLILAPFDALADGLRGLRGIMVDVHKRPEKILEACETLIPELVNAALAAADPLRRYPIFMPLHRGCYPFLSPKQFDELYWPSLKKTVQMLIDAGYTVRAYLEGNWGPNWHHWRELPRGKVLLDIDGPGDIFKAKEDLGGYQCIAGGLSDSLLVLGTPDEVRERVKLLCETVGKDGGFIISGGCNIPYDTKPENYRAMIDAILEYGRYRDKTEFEVQCNPNPPAGWQPPKQRMITPWEVKKAELGEIKGDEDLIRMHWEMFERMAYNWLWNWTW